MIQADLKLLNYDASQKSSQLVAGTFQMTYVPRSSRTLPEQAHNILRKYELRGAFKKFLCLLYNFRTR